ncbi:MAG: thioredoxin [Chloroflexi bacterium]|nr:thioredoxin [Chloroflexota bacterium]
MALREVTSQEFESQVLRSPRPVLVDFTAEWCAPCKLLKPVLEELAAEWQGKVDIVEFDVDKDPSMAARYRVLGVPTMILFVDGQAKARITGFKPKPKIVKKFGPYIA